MKKGDIAIQINNPEESQFVKILGIHGDNIEHLHLNDKKFTTSGITSKRVIRKCTKRELMIAKIKYGL